MNVLGCATIVAMRTKGTLEQLAARRERALQLLKKGYGAQAVAEAVGVTPQTVRRWRKQPKPRRRRRPLGRPARLTAKQVERLERELERGAPSHGYTGDFWTLERMGQLIWQLFGVRYHPSGVWHLMQRVGWSSQRVQRRSIARDDGAVAHWRRYVWPQTKKVSATWRKADLAG